MVDKSLQVEESEVKVFDKFSLEDGIIGWMDGGGSNLVKINEQLPGIVKLVATTRSEKDGSNARKRSEEFGVPFAEFDFIAHEKEYDIHPGDYSRALGLLEIEEKLKQKDLAPEQLSELNIQHADLKSKIKSKTYVEDPLMIKNARVISGILFDRLILNTIYKKLPVFAAGGKALLPDYFVNKYFIINVHPGDLTKLDDYGKRLLVGDAWVASAKALELKYPRLYSSTHLMNSGMDEGPVFMRGYPLDIDYSRIEKLGYDLTKPKDRKIVGSAAQEALRHIGDHVIAGATFMDLFNKKWGNHTSTDNLAYNYLGTWYAVPKGITIRDHITNNPNTIFQRSPEFLEEKINDFYNTIEEAKKNG